MINALLLSLFLGTPPPADEYAVFFLVDAERLNYRNTTKLIRSMRLDKGGDVGHAWIALTSRTSEGVFILEGGHSGETGRVRPKYIEGILDLVNSGDPNPVKYLWAQLGDGYFEKGGGYHSPTLVARKKITREQFERIRDFVDPDSYDYSQFSITERNCSRFVADVANEVGVALEFERVVPVEKWVLMKGKRVSVYDDPTYRQIGIGSCDTLQASLRKAIKRGELSYGKGDLARLRRLNRKQPAPAPGEQGPVTEGREADARDGREGDGT